MANVNTPHNIGIRRNFTTLGYRNFETAPTAPVQYVAVKAGLEFLGTRYAAAANLPFDVGGTHYSPTANKLLTLYWNQGFIKPTT